MAEEPDVRAPEPAATPNAQPSGYTVSPSGRRSRRTGSADMLLVRLCVGEVIGTYLLVTVGAGVVAASLLGGAHVGVWQVAIITGIGVALAIYATAAVSGAMSV